MGLISITTDSYSMGPITITDSYSVGLISITTDSYPMGLISITLIHIKRERFLFSTPVACFAEDNTAKELCLSSVTILPVLLHISFASCCVSPATNTRPRGTPAETIGCMQYRQRP
jgi:hypothetical protein